MFGDLDAGVEGFRSIVRENRNRFLAQDFTAIDPGIHEMDSATRDRSFGIDGLFPSGEAREEREEGGVDIDDTVGEGGEERRFDDAHIASEDDEFDAEGEEGGDEICFVGRRETGAKFRFREGEVGDIRGAGDIEDARRGLVRSDEGDFCVQLLGLDGRENGLAVRAFARAEDADADGSRSFGIRKIHGDGSEYATGGAS